MPRHRGAFPSPGPASPENTATSAHTGLRESAQARPAPPSASGGETPGRAGLAAGRGAPPFQEDMPTTEEELVRRRGAGQGTGPGPASPALSPPGSGSGSGCDLELGLVTAAKGKCGVERLTNERPPE